MVFKLCRMFYHVSSFCNRHNNSMCNLNNMSLIRYISDIFALVKADQLDS